MRKEKWELDQVNFNNPDNDSWGIEEMILTSHEPSLMYESMKELKKFIESREELDNAVRSRLQVELYQMGVQYVESFFIYLTSHFHQERPLVADLTNTFPGEIREFCYYVRSDTVNEFLDEIGLESTYADYLREIFGYNFHRSIGEDISTDELEQYIAESVSVLQDRIKRLANFYIGYTNIYNAIKHGDRVIHMSFGEMKFKREDSGQEEKIGSKSDYLTFICRNHAEESVYLFYSPAEYLMDLIWPVVENTQTIFTHLREARVESIEKDGTKLNLYTYNDEESFQKSPKQKWIRYQNEDVRGVVKHPNQEIPQYIQENTISRENTIPGKIIQSKGRLELEINPNAAISESYPIEITFQNKGSVGMTMQSEVNFNISFRLDLLNIERYKHLRELYRENNGKIDSIKFVNSESGEEFENESHVPIQLPKFVELIDEDYLEYLSNKQRALDRSIPVPIYGISKGQKDIIDEYRDKEGSLGRDEVEDMFGKIEDIGENREWCEVVIQKIAPNGDILQEETIGSFPGSLNIDLNSKVGNIDSNSGKVGDYVSWSVKDYPLTYNSIKSHIYDFPEDIYLLVKDAISRKQGFTVDIDEGLTNADLVFKYFYRDSQVWHCEHLLQMKIIQLEECSICDSVMKRPLSKHLMSNCYLSKEN